MRPPKFQKRHYIAIAALLHEARYDSPRRVDYITKWFIHMFTSDNGNFSPERFKIAVKDGLRAKYVGADIQGGPAMPYYDEDRAGRRNKR